jgi:predicted nuclease of predicted toxin-antitoxin system
MMRFIVDEQLPPRLATWLRDQGHEVQHVIEIDLGGASDARVHERCVVLGAVLVTKDADFRPQRRNQVPVVWLRMGNISTAELIRRFARAFGEIEEALAAGETLVEVA